MTNVLLAAIAVTLFLGLLGTYFLALRTPQLITTEYEAVLLDNGSAFFGKPDRITRDFIVIRDVFYVQSHTDPDTKQVSNVLVKRGREWHGPDRMVINRQHVVFLEPVSPGSTVAQRIEESKRQ